MSKKLKFANMRHSSLDLAESESKTKRDMLAKARNKLLVLGDALKHRRPDENQNNKPLAKSMTQCTLDYLFKNAQNKEKDHSFQSATSRALQKQLSLTSYPVEIKISSFDDENLALKPISRIRPATISGDGITSSATEALALERPKKRLSFKEPEVVEENNRRAAECVKQRLGNGYSKGLNTESDSFKGNKNNLVVGNGVHRVPSYEDTNLDSQAMRVVRTIGQAFEVCHKLSITAPENEDTLDPDEQETLTQDLHSDRFSDVASSDKPKKDIISEGASDKASLPADDCISIKDIYPYENNSKHHRSVQLDILASPPPSSKKSQLSAETYAAPHSDILGSTGLGANSTGISSGGALSVHHELHLMREQLEQQNQQTQAAMSQLQLAREQLSAEKAARLEAQARTHQLLIHNRELLDHIAALVAHLQGGEKPGEQPTPPHMAMPQYNQQMSSDSNYSQDYADLPPQLDNNLILQALGLNSQSLIENRRIGANLPTSPLRNSFPGTGGVFNFNPYSPPATETNYESYQLNQILQRLQSLGSYPCTPPYNMGQSMPYLYNTNPLMNNYYGIQNPTQSSYQPNVYATLPRNFSNLDNRAQNSRHSEPRTLPSDRYSATSNLAYQSPTISAEKYQKPTFPNAKQQEPNQSQQNKNLTLPGIRRNVSQSNLEQNSIPTNTNLFRSNSTLQISQDLRQPSSLRKPSENVSRDAHFIKPQGQMGTLTTTDADGRVRVIVPVPSNSIDEADDTLSNLRINDEIRLMNGPGISRSCSERVPNRSELMSQVQRTWARHTTK